MANKIQIKRSTTTAAPTGLANGELAYTSNGELLFIGHPDGTTGSIAIGGRRNPGTLTANQALVANSTSGIDKVIVANLAPTAIWANGSIGTAGQILASNGSVVYWAPAPSGVTDLTDSANSTTVTIISSTGADAILDGANSSTAGVMTAADKSKLDAIPAGAVAGTNTQVMFNNSGALAGDAGFTFQTGTQILRANNVTVANTLYFDGGWSINQGSFVAANATTTAEIASFNFSSGLYAMGNSAFVYSTSAGPTYNEWEFRGNIIYLPANGSIEDSDGVNTVQLNSVNGYVVTTNTYTMSFSTAGILTLPNKLVIGTQIEANGSVGTAGQVLASGGAGNVYWTAAGASGTVTSVAGGNGLTGSVTTSGSLDVGAGNGISVGTDAVSVNANSGLIANSTGLFVNANNGIVSNSSGVFVTGGAGLVANSTGVHVGQGNGLAVDADSVRVQQANGIAVDAGGVRVAAGPTLTVNTSGVHVNSTLSITDLVLSGNLDINGTLTTVDTTNLSVTDSIISLARGQTTANTLDIGFYGTYGNATTTSYSGLFRDATDGVYRLFAGQIPEPTTTVDTANVNFAYATLQAYLNTGALVANSTAVNITANSTVSVALTANSLSLSTALPATSGGTGQSTYAVGDLLVGGAGNTLAKLTVGTDGKVLQSNGTSVVYADLDGGTF